MSLGWFADLNDAKTYFVNERLITEHWDNLTTDALKTKAVVNSYNRIFYCGLYSLPTYVQATVAQLIILKKVNGEMAYYLAEHLQDEDSRKGLEAQAVTEAGIVKEVYDPNNLNTLPIPPFVQAMLAPLLTVKGFNIRDLGRDENYHVYNEGSLYDHLK